MLMTTTVLVHVGGFDAVTLCHSSAVQPLAFSSANSNSFILGGNVLPSMASYTPWNVQVVVMSIS